jgi:hypothetical protein
MRTRTQLSLERQYQYCLRQQREHDQFCLALGAAGLAICLVIADIMLGFAFSDFLIESVSGLFSTVDTMLAAVGL